MVEGGRRAGNPEHQKFPRTRERSPVPELSSKQNFHLDLRVEWPVSPKCLCSLFLS